MYGAYAGAVALVQAPIDIGQTLCLLCRMIHTVDEVESVTFANRDKLKIDKGAHDFTRRIAKISGVGDRNAAPDGTCSVPLTPISRLLGAKDVVPAFCPSVLTLPVFFPERCSCWYSCQSRMAAACLTQDVCYAALWNMINLKSKKGKIDPSLQDCQEETEMIMFDVVENVLKKTSIDPKKVLCLPLTSPTTPGTPTLHAASHPERKPWRLCSAAGTDAVGHRVAAALMWPSLLPADQHCHHLLQPHLLMRKPHTKHGSTDVCISLPCRLTS